VCLGGDAHGDNFDFLAEHQLFRYPLRTVVVSGRVTESRFDQWVRVSLDARAELADLFARVRSADPQAAGGAGPFRRRDRRRAVSSARSGRR
jgi:hypothetical protein